MPQTHRRTQIKIRSVASALFVRMSLCGSVANFVFKLCVADIIYCIFKDADTEGGDWFVFDFAALCFFFIARPVRVVGKVIVGFRVWHKAEYTAGGIAYSCDIV